MRTVVSARALVLLITFITGFTGLVYEVTWHRYLANLLGSQAQASAIILAVFLGGLSVGYAIFGAVSRSSNGVRLVQLCGLLEVGIGFWGIFFPKTYNLIFHGLGIANLGFLRDIFIAVILVGPPTILMGGTLPLLTQGLARSVADSSPLHARIYAVNTAGAFVGALAGGFYMLPEFGLSLTVLFMGTINVLAGAALLLLSRGFGEPISKIAAESNETDMVSPPAIPGAEIGLGRALVVAFIAGLVSITLQTVIIRLTGISAGSSEYSFAMVVGVFICMLAFGAWITSRLPATYTLHVNAQLLFIGAVIAYLSGDKWPYANHVIRVLFTSTTPTFYIFYIFAFIAIGVVLAIPVGAMGSTMPLLFRSLRRSSGTLGRSVGLLYCVNTLGCVVGALVGGYAALTVFDLDEIFRICLVLVTISIFIVCPIRGEEFVVTLRRVLTVASMILLVVVLKPWDRERLAFGTFRATTPRPTSFAGPTEFYRHFSSNLEVLAYKDDPNTSVAIIESPTDSEEAEQFGVTTSRSLYVNGKSDGASIGSDLRTTRLVGHIPALLSPFESPNVAVVGFGLGGTVGSLTLYPEIKRIDVIEIAPAVREFSKFFSATNHSAGTNPKVRWNMGDAYRILGSSTERYSIIVSEPSNPWVAGVERLYAQDFYDIVKAKLTPHGYYAQWFHTYSISELTIGLIFNTFRASFPNVRVFEFGSDVLLVGSMEPIGAVEAARMDQRADRPEIQADLQLFGFVKALQILALERWLDLEAFANYGKHTLEFPKLAFAAGKDFFLGEGAQLEVLMENPVWATKFRVRGAASLAAELVGLPMSIPAAIMYGEMSCGLRPLKFFKNWEMDSRACRSTLGRLLVENAIELPENFTESDREILTYFAGRDLPKPVLESEDFQKELRAIYLYGTFDSPYFQLDVERLRAVVKPCYDSEELTAVFCRKGVLAALEQVGRRKRTEDSEK